MVLGPVLAVATLLLAPTIVHAQIPEQCRNATLSYDISFVGALRHITVGNVKFGYHRFGPLRAGVTAENAKLPPLVMLSGIGTYMYIHPIPILQKSAAEREVIIFDHAGVGASTFVDGKPPPLHIPDMAANSAEFIKALELPRKPDLYGWSLGGAVVTAMAAFHGDALRHGVIINGWAGGDRSYVMPERSLDAFLSVRGNINKYLEFMFPKGVKDEGACALYATWNSFYESPYVKQMAPMTAEILTQQFNAMEASMKSNDVLTALPAVRSRLLVFAATQDALVPVRNGAVIANPVPGSWSLRFADEGHGLPFESPKSVIYLMSEFWNFATELTESDVAGMSYGVLAKDAPAPLPSKLAPRRPPAAGTVQTISGGTAPAPRRAAAGPPGAPRRQAPPMP